MNPTAFEGKKLSETKMSLVTYKHNECIVGKTFRLSNHSVDGEINCVMADPREAFRAAVQAILQKDAGLLCVALTYVFMPIEMVLSIGIQSWRADVKANQIGVRMHSGGLLSAVFMGIFKAQQRSGTLDQGDNAVLFMAALAAKHDDVQILDVLFEWDPGFGIGPPHAVTDETTAMFFVHMTAPLCSEYMLNRKNKKAARVQANRELLENLRQPRAATAAVRGMIGSNMPTNKHEPDGETEHARKVRERDAAESKMFDERERELRAKIVAERTARANATPRPYTASGPSRKANTPVGMEAPPDAQARAKQETKKAAALENAARHAVELQLAEAARVAAEEVKLEQRRIGRAIGGA